MGPSRVLFRLVVVLALGACTVRRVDDSGEAGDAGETNDETGDPFSTGLVTTSGVGAADDGATSFVTTAGDSGSGSQTSGSTTEVGGPCVPDAACAPDGSCGSPGSGAGPLFDPGTSEPAPRNGATLPGTCGPAAYCAGMGCDGEGTCEPLPRACDTVRDPVCGCDGRSYANPCLAAQARTRVAFPGSCACDKAGLRCWVDDLPYPPACKSCRGDADCAIVQHVQDCCGGVLYLGIHQGAVSSFDAAEYDCQSRATFACDCYNPPVAEDGLVIEDPAQVAVACTAGLCRSFAAY